MAIEACLHAAYLENREGGAAARRVPLHPRTAPYGRHWSLEGLFGGTFRRWRAPEEAMHIAYPYREYI